MTTNATAALRAEFDRIKNLLEEREGLNDDIKEILDNIEKSFDIPKKVARKVAALIHKKNKEELERENGVVADLYEQLTS